MKKISTGKYLVKPHTRVHLDRLKSDDKSLFLHHEKQAKGQLEKLRQRLRKLQNLLYAQHKHKVLIVLQAMDTGGKDSTIRLVFRGVNPQGVKVACFGAPSRRELDYDYLWRIHGKVPAKGEMVIFNRSHYEDVLIVRVHHLVPPVVWKKRFRQINDFEQMLVEEGTVILKFFLHISQEEQKKRLEERLKDPHKRWKFQISDLNERKLWPEYTKAYEDVFKYTSTTWAPWYLIPADDKLTRNLIIANILVETLEDLKMKYPKPAKRLEKIILR